MAGTLRFGHPTRFDHFCAVIARLDRACLRCGGIITNGAVLARWLVRMVSDAFNAIDIEIQCAHT
jgi:hypothetical protein